MGPDSLYVQYRTCPSYFHILELVAYLNRRPKDIIALELTASLRGVAQGDLSDLPADQRKRYTSLSIN